VVGTHAFLPGGQPRYSPLAVICQAKRSMDEELGNMRSRCTYLLWVFVTCVGTFCWAPRLAAEPPWSKLLLFKRIEADPDKDYALTEKEGPWMIMAATFSGEGAMSQARELVYELRSRYKLPAYTHDMQFDFSQGPYQGASGQSPSDRRYRYRLDKRYEVAVLVGNYPSVDDPEAQRVLKKIKYIQPECMQLEKRIKEGKKDSRTLGAFRLAQLAVHEVARTANRQKGPLGHAFITTNPLLPDEYFVPPGIDPLVEEINKPVQYSLLDCPGRYSCRVATFTGAALIDPLDIRAVEEGRGKLPSRLAEAAERAHKLTMALRAEGIEAYEFHDRYSSIVTVGSFDWIWKTDEQGRTIMNPAAEEVINTFGMEQKGALQPGATAQVRSKDGIPFDILPVPIEVPRRSVAARYERRVQGSRP